MNTRRIYPLILAISATLTGGLRAQPTAHYPPGVHGINAGSLPLPGFYLRDYNLFYSSDHLNGPTGERTGPANFDAFTYANIVRPIWITDVNFLGAYLGADVVVPLVYKRLEAGSFDDASFGLGDILPEVTLSWHVTHFDVTCGVGEWMPTGESAPKPTTRAGLGYWGTMFTLGGTWFIDNARTWSISVLNRYEINMESRDTHTTTGNAWTLEGGAGKAFTKIITGGVAGYYQAKVTDDSGAHPQPLNHVAAIGPEVVFRFDKPKLVVNVRYEYEFVAENRAQGHTAAVVLTKRF